MSKKLMSVTVKGREKTWSFNFYGDPKYLKDWEDDGLDVVQIVNIIPERIVNAGLLVPYLIVQDLFNFKFVEAWSTLKSALARSKSG